MDSTPRVLVLAVRIDASRKLYLDRYCSSKFTVVSSL